jgi:hypothetical protein
MSCSLKNINQLGVLALFCALFAPAAVVAQNSFGVSRVVAQAKPSEPNPSEPSYEFEHTEELSEVLTAPAPRAEGFYAREAGAVTDIFGPHLSLSEKQELRPFNNSKGASRRTTAVEESGSEAQPVPQSAPQRVDKKFKSREEIINAFGDPNERQPVLARPDAPQSMQAILQARELGDKELEQAYIKQHVDYLLELDDRTKAVSLDIAREVERRKAGGEEEADTNPALFGKVQQDKPAAKAKRPSEVAIQIPAALRSKIPVDPKGEVDVIWFIHPGDADVLAMAPAVQQIFNRSKSDRSVSFTAMTIGALDQQAVTDFRRKAQVSFPIRSGFSLARGLGYSKSPTIVVMSRSTGKSVDLQGVQELKLLNAVIAAAQGRGA